MNYSFPAESPPSYMSLGPCRSSSTPSGQPTLNLSKSRSSPSITYLPRGPISTLAETTPVLKHLSSLGSPSATAGDVVTVFLQLQVDVRISRSRLVPRVDDSADEGLRRAWSS